MEDKGVFKMKGMNNSREKLESGLMKVTGGAAETDLVTIKKKELGLVPETCHKRMCNMCHKTISEYCQPGVIPVTEPICDKCKESRDKKFLSSSKEKNKKI